MLFVVVVVDAKVVRRPVVEVKGRLWIGMIVRVRRAAAAALLVVVGSREKDRVAVKRNSKMLIVVVPRDTLMEQSKVVGFRYSS